MNFQNSGGVLCFLPKVEKGKEEQREGGRRKGEKRARRFLLVHDDRDVHAECLPRLPREYTKIPFDVHRKGSPQEKCA